MGSGRPKRKRSLLPPRIYCVDPEKQSNQTKCSGEPSEMLDVMSSANWRDLVLWFLIKRPENAPPAPKWLAVQNKAAVTKVVVAFLPGYDADVFNFPKFNQLGFIRPTRLGTNGNHPKLGHIEQEIAQVPLSKHEKKILSREQSKWERTGGLVPLRDLLLSTTSRLESGYEDVPIDDSWVDLGKAIGVTGSQTLIDYISVDCEMVSTHLGQALARVSVVDSNEKALYDTFVSVPEPITDYLTQYSGITPEILEGVTTTLKDVQQWFIENIKPSIALVGHSLNFDLRALKLTFPNVIDTASIYQYTGNQNSKPALRYLAGRYLDHKIQQGVAGHDSIEDATTCIRLVKLKRTKGLQYGCHTGDQTIAEKLAKEDLKMAVVGSQRAAWDTSHASLVHLTATDKEAAEFAAKAARVNDLVFVKFTEYLQLSCQSRKEEKGGDEESKDQSVWANTLNQARDALSETLWSMRSKLSPSTVLITLTDHGDPTQFYELRNRKNQSRKDFHTKKWDEGVQWSHADDVELARVTRKLNLASGSIILGPEQEPHHDNSEWSDLKRAKSEGQEDSMV